MPGQAKHNTRPHNRLPHTFLSMDDCLDDLTTERSFDSQGTWVIVCLACFFEMLSLVVGIPGCTGRRSVDWCRNEMSVLYISSPKMHMSEKTSDASKLGDEQCRDTLVCIL